MPTNHLHVKLKQTQQLSQNLQQSLKVLQMSSLEVEREVEEWLFENPLLEREEIAEKKYDYSYSSQSNQTVSSDVYHAWEHLPEQETFHQYLHRQVCEYPLTKLEAAHIHILIDFLDEQGYLTDSIEDIIEHTPLEWMLTEEALERALDKLRTFEPAGVATENLGQSLLYQLDNLPLSNIRLCAMRIVAQYLDQISQNTGKNITRLAKLLPEFSTDELKEALEMIAQLNPYPAYGFANAEQTNYVQPDVFVDYHNNKWIVISNEEACPKLKMNGDLAEALQEEESIDPVWKEKVLSAKQKIEMLQSRQSTVLRVAQYIVDKQTDFFTFGEISLVPMLIKDCAAELELSNSTISRAVNSKYLACPQGVFPLRYFFNHSTYDNKQNEGMSSNVIRIFLEQLLKNEDKNKPLTDSALHQLLEQQGIYIARRTVAKYREQLGIPSAQQRRQTA